MLISYIPRRTGQAPESSSGQDPNEESGQVMCFLVIPKHRDCYLLFVICHFWFIQVRVVKREQGVFQ